MSDKPSTVCVVGACFIDLISYVSKFPGHGETIHGKSFARGFGGKGANQAVAIAKLRGSENTNVIMVGAVGADGDGDSYLETLKKAGVDSKAISRHPESFTGNAPIFVQDGGENMIVINPGATSLVGPHSTSTGTPGGDAIAAADIVVCQNEVPVDATSAALKVAHEAGKITVWNVAPVTDAAVAAAASILPTVSVLIVNETEAAQLVAGVEGTPFEAPADDDASVETATALAKRLVAAGAAVVLVTLGKQGAAFAAKESDEVATGAVAAVVVPKEKVVDTTGAGDCFVGAFVHNLVGGGVRGKAGGGDGTIAVSAIRSAVGFACRAAAVSVQHPGTQSSYPSADQVAAE